MQLSPNAYIPSQAHDSKELLLRILQIKIL